MRRTAICDVRLVNPAELVERMCDSLLDGLLGDVAGELHAACNTVVEDMVTSELA